MSPPSDELNASLTSFEAGGLAVLGGYIVEAELGRGGMGRVLRARKGERPVALKLLLSDDAQVRLRFAREAQALVAVGAHPHIVEVIEAFEDAGRPVLAMELVEGEDLAARFAREGPYDWDEALSWLRPIAEALAFVHARGMTHRDLKPANILIREEDDAPLLSDFGIVRVAALETLTRTGEMVGTPAYMAPEQIDGDREAIGPATDVWAFAVILSELLGARPFFGASSAGFAKAILFGEPALPEDLSPAQRAFFAAALSKDPAGRPADGAALLAALDEACVEPRTRLPVGLIVAALLLGFSLTLGGLFAWQRAASARRGVARAEARARAEAAAALAEARARLRLWRALARAGAACDLASESHAPEDAVAACEAELRALNGELAEAAAIPHDAEALEAAAVALEAGDLLALQERRRGLSLTRPAPLLELAGALAALELGGAAEALRGWEAIAGLKAPPLELAALRARLSAQLLLEALAAEQAPAEAEVAAAWDAVDACLTGAPRSGFESAFAAAAVKANPSRVERLTRALPAALLGELGARVEAWLCAPREGAEQVAAFQLTLRLRFRDPSFRPDLKPFLPLINLRGDSPLEGLVGLRGGVRLADYALSFDDACCKTGQHKDTYRQGIALTRAAAIEGVLLEPGREALWSTEIRGQLGASETWTRLWRAQVRPWPGFTTKRYAIHSEGALLDGARLAAHLDGIWAATEACLRDPALGPAWRGRIHMARGRFLADLRRHPEVFLKPSLRPGPFHALIVERYGDFAALGERALAEYEAAAATPMPGRDDLLRHLHELTGDPAHLDAAFLAFLQRWGSGGRPPEGEAIWAPMTGLKGSLSDLLERYRQAELRTEELRAPPLAMEATMARALACADRAVRAHAQDRAWLAFVAEQALILSRDSLTNGCPMHASTPVLRRLAEQAQAALRQAGSGG